MLTDFDFLLGNWQVLNTRLSKWLCGCQQWIEFESYHTEKRMIDGKGSVGLHHYQNAGTLIERCVVRQLDPVHQFWKVCRLDLWSTLKVNPLQGTFWSNKGCFLSRGWYNERNVLVWVEWTNISKSLVSWEQALSSDEGRTWETNWRMDFFRV